MLRFLRGATKRTKWIWWVITIATVFSFLLGFSLFLGMGDPSRQARQSGSVGSINGQAVSREEWQNALAAQTAQYKARYGVDPADRDAKVVETQAWRSLVVRRLFEAEARKSGLGVTPREVVLSLQASPPQEVMSSPAFQTNGQFDMQKYSAALHDPNVNWTPAEDLVRQQLPIRKLQERLISAVKVPAPELMQAFHDRFDRAVAVVVSIPGTPDTTLPPPSDADQQRVYERYKTRFMTSPRTQLELLVVPKTVSESEVNVARETAAGLAKRARAGEDWNGLVRDYSEVQTAKPGGELDRAFQAAEFGPELGPKMATMNVGEVTDPMRDGSRFIVFRIIEKNPPAAPGAPPTIKVGQLVTKIRGDDDKLRAQLRDLEGLRKRAIAAGLGTASAEKGLATATSEFYNANSTPQALTDVPEAADWGLSAKVGAVSPVFMGVDQFAIVQVKVQQPAGLVPRDRLGDALRQLAEVDMRVDRAKPVADDVARLIAAGQPLEQAGAANGFAPQRVENLNRAAPDPRVAAAPELVGMLFASPPGKVLGPVRGLNGWYFGRLESIAVADTAQFNATAQQLEQELIQRRQQAFFSEYVAQLRAKAKVTDLRSAYTY